MISRLLATTSAAATARYAGTPAATTPSPPPSVAGWRYWMVEDSADGPVLRDPLVRTGGTSPSPPWSTASQRTARCMFASHPAPQEPCSCGYRLVESLDDLIAFLPHYIHGPRPPLAFGRCIGSGARYAGFPPSWGRTGDPAGTWRVERITLTGPLLLTPDAMPFEAALEAAFAIEVRALEHPLS